MKKVGNILLIEDDHIAIFIAKTNLDRIFQYNDLLIAHNGEEALNLLKSIEDPNLLPDLVLLDINMPLVDGWDFMDHISELNLKKEIPIFILTSSIDPSDIRKSQQYSEIKGFLSKPITTQALDEILQSVHPE